MAEFSNRVALVTGAGRGLGFAYADALAAHGATVIVQDSGTDGDGTCADPAVARAAAHRIAARGGAALAEPDSIDGRDACRAMIARCLATHGRLDVLIHNAGFVAYQEVGAIEPATLSRMLGLGVDSALWLVQAAWPAMREARFGRVLLTTSDRAIYPEYAQEGLAAYAAAKLAAVGLVNVLALEGRPHGITVNAVSPIAKTRMWGVEGEPDELKPEAVAPGVLHLVSAECEESGWVLRAAGGQFVATRAFEAQGVAYPRDLRGVAAATPEEVARAWPRIAVAAPEPRSSVADVEFPAEAVLGESPVWSERRKRLLWVDTEGRTLNRFDPATGRNAALGMPDVIGMVAEASDGTLVAALGCDLAAVEEDGEVRRFATVPHGGDGFRLNDGRFDAAGRLWIGLMDKALAPGSGRLLRYDTDGNWHLMDEGFALVNGLDWSPDRHTLYVTDSREPAIYAYPHDPETGALGERRTLIRFGPEDGFPDGLLASPGGEIWSTLFGGGAIWRIRPDGLVAERLALPVPRPTSCTFTAERDGLFVTTARLGLDAPALERFPASGALLRVAI